MDKKSNKSIDAFRNVIENSPEMDDYEKVSKAMKAMNREILISFPIDLRVNCILGMIANAEQSHKDFQLDLKSINEILNENIDEYDFNIIPKITSVDDLINLRSKIIDGLVINGDWRKCKCKKCGEEFFLSFGEVEFFRKKGFPLPKQCTYCKKGIKNPKKEIKKETVEKIEETLPTEMELVLKKAGFKF